MHQSTYQSHTTYQKLVTVSNSQTNTSQVPEQQQGMQVPHMLLAEGGVPGHRTRMPSQNLSSAATGAAWHGITAHMPHEPSPSAYICAKCDPNSWQPRPVAA